MAFDNRRCPYGKESKPRNVPRDVYYSLELRHNF
jgi:hypothetical protein